LLLVSVGATICLIGAYSAWYATDRYDHLRKKVTEELEPGWSKKMKPPKRVIEPGYLIWFVPFALFVATCWVIFPDQHPIAWFLTALTILGYILWLRQIIRTGE